MNEFVATGTTSLIGAMAFIVILAAGSGLALCFSERKIKREEDH